MSALGTGISAQLEKTDLTDFAGILDNIQSLGAETIEIPLYDMDVVVGGRIRPERLKLLTDACNGRDVTYTVHGPLATNFLDQSFRIPRHMEVLKASLDASAEIGAVHYVMHTGLIPMQLSEGIEAAYERQREQLAIAGDYARDRGVILCVENLFGGYEGKVHTATPARLARELAEIDHSHVLATLDFSHAYLHCNFLGLHFLTEVEQFAPYAKHLHMHDSFGRQDDTWMFTDGERTAYGHGDLHLPVGWGNIPWDDIFTRCSFPDETVLNIELKKRYWYEAHNVIATTKNYASRVRSYERAAA
ncbi:sugar phosphate isomerase/epimerase family protein [Chelativorans sp. YIM 93263]|uniref:sugar phosphate isomerase/epimerase family protein n=1 Tax=Chelativorans sp. YIM 93263 TaxID=2906648 RepID=UPI00237949AA|nr:sugar phosphate isomerase/epimerase [Chelativorans sp. YIM 93263]